MPEPVHPTAASGASAELHGRAPSAPPPRPAWKLVLPIGLMVVVAVVVLTLLGRG